MEQKYYHLNLRNWRKQITGKVEYVRTLQFPLITEQKIEDFKQFEDLYNILNGCKKGTINGLICALHLSGFKFFGTGSEAEDFFVKQQSADTFSFKELYELGISTKLQPNSLVKFLTTGRRKENNLVNEKTLQKEKDKFLKDFSDKKDDSQINAILDNWFDYIKTNYQEFSQFQKDNELLKGVFNAFIDACIKQGLNIPQNLYEDLLEKKKQVNLPEYSTIVFDKTRISDFNLKDIEESEYLTHITVAHLRNIDQNIDNLIPGTNFSSLSWLLGDGLKLWQTAEVKTICQNYNIPLEYENMIAELKTWFTCLDDNKNIFTSNFADYRTAVGGALQSWTTNYLNRLKVLEEKDFSVKIPKELYEQDADIIKKYPYSLNTIEKNISLLDIKKYKESLSCLLGNHSEKLNKDIFETITNTIESYNDIIGQIEADINIANQKNEKEIKNENEKIEKINRLTGGTPNPQTEIDLALEKFNDLQKETYNFAQFVLDNYSDNSTSILDILSKQEEEKIKEAKKEIKNSAQEQAKRFILQRVFSLAKNEPILLKIVYDYCKKINLFTKANLNRLLINKVGQVYKSPYSTKNDDATILNKEVLNKLNFLEMLKEIYQTIMQVNTKQALRARLAMKHLYYSVLLIGIKDTINLDFSQYPFLQEIPMPKYILNQKENIEKKTIINILNYCKSYLNSFLFILTRDNFIIRTNFSIVGNYELFYAPKTTFKNGKTVWQIPPLYRQGKFSEILKDWSKVLDTQELKEKLKTITLKEEAEKTYREFLTQVPHDLYINLGLKEQSKKFGFKFGKGQIKNLWKDNLGCFAKLVGPSKYKNILDKSLIDSHFIISEYTLLFEQEYTQNIEIEKDTISKVQISPKGNVSCRVHIPVKETNTQEPLLLDKTVIGIDLGEAGIGYAVFPISEIEKSIKEDYMPKPTAFGTKAIGSIKKLMSSVKKYRKNTQRRQKFQKQYSDRQAKFRANVAGDIAHHIDNLCKKYEGFPVLEKTVRNLSSGSKQLMNVYDKVLNMYCFSDIDAHTKERKSHWMQQRANKAIQEHPIFKQFKTEKGKKIEQKEPLKLFIGQSIGAAATSQCCSHCGRNPLLSFEEEYGRDSNAKNIKVENSSVKVANGILLLRKENYSQKEKNRAIPFNLPLEEGKQISASEGYRILKKQLRQRPKDLRSKDTTQSQYYCPYADCGKAEFTMHADANAAVNIVRKWSAMKLKAHIKPFWREKKENIDKE